MLPTMKKNIFASRRSSIKNRVERKAEVKPAPKSSNDFLGSLLKIFGVLGITLSFFGYFVAAGIADELGQDFGMLISTPSDLSYFATLGFLSFFSHAKFDLTSFLYQYFKANAFLIFVVGSVLSLILIGLTQNSSDERDF
jgi:hypothetical protein